MYKERIETYLKNNGFGAFDPKAVLFDMDGVLYDSMPNHARSWHLSMETFGLKMSEKEAYKYEGMRGVETIRLIAKEQWGRDLSEAECVRMYAEKSRLFAEQPEAGIMNGVRTVLEMVHRSGRKIVVVTGSGQHSLLDKLVSDFDGLISHDMIVSSFDVKRGKPDPEPYLKGLEKAGVNAWEAIVVENAPLGVRAAVAARIFTIAVNTGPLDNELLTAEGADIVLGSMGEFNGDVYSELLATCLAVS